MVVILVVVVVLALVVVAVFLIDLIRFVRNVPISRNDDVTCVQKKID